MDINEVIAAYIKLRDARDELKKKHAEELEPITSKMSKVEAWLQTHLTTQGIDSVKGAAGTAFLKEVTSATVEDGEAFFAHVKLTGQWELLERRCAKSVVEDYVREKGELPPGIKYTATMVCQVRRG